MSCGGLRGVARCSRPRGNARGGQFGQVVRPHAPDRRAPPGEGSGRVRTTEERTVADLCLQVLGLSIGRLEGLLRGGVLERRGRGGPLQGPPEQRTRSVARPLEPLEGHACPARPPMRCAAGAWACWRWGRVSLNTPRPGWPSRRGQARAPPPLLGGPEMAAVARLERRRRGTSHMEPGLDSPGRETGAECWPARPCRMRGSVVVAGLEGHHLLS